MEILNPNTVQITIDLDEAHATSVGLIGFMSEQNLPVSTAVAALIMSVGRLLAPTDLNEEDELKFTQATLDWVAAFFTEGMAN